MREYTALALAGNTAAAAEVAATLDPVRAVAGTWLHGEAPGGVAAPCPTSRPGPGLQITPSAF